MEGELEIGVCVCVSNIHMYRKSTENVSFILNVNNKQLFIRRPVMYSLQGLYCICSGKKDKDEMNNAAPTCVVTRRSKLGF